MQANDLISREETANRLEDLATLYREKGRTLIGNTLFFAAKIVRGVPSAMKRGHWVIHSSGNKYDTTNWAECSNCHVCGNPQWTICPVCESWMCNEDNQRKENDNNAED